MFKPTTLKQEFTGIGKIISYHGFELNIPVDCHALATDYDGEIFAYLSIPSLSSDKTAWNSTENAFLVATCTFEGNPKDSLSIIGSNV